MRLCIHTVPRRAISSSTIQRSGHNKWSKIRHSKGAIDSQRAKLFSRLSNDITIAAKLGGPDPLYNVRLAACLTSAKKADMPKNNIETAIKRASGLLKDGGALETATYEATFGTTGLVIETLTDKKTRTIASLKSILKKGGATLSPCLFMFDRVGCIVIPSPPIPSSTSSTTLSPEQETKMDETMMDLAIEVGALDVSAQPLDERIDASGRDQSTRTYAFITAATDLNAVAGALKSAGHDLLEAELQYRPKDSPIATTTFTSSSNTRANEESVSDLAALVDALEEDGDIVRVTSSTPLN